MTRAAREAAHYFWDGSPHGSGTSKTHLRRRQRRLAKRRREREAERDRARMDWLCDSGHSAALLREAWALRLGHSVPGDLRQVVDDLMSPRR